MQAWEINFDGLVGPTHNYAGLAYGNVASEKHKALTSNPKQAARQGLDKMKALHDIGVLQAVIAPQERPDLLTLSQLGFSGTDTEILSVAARNPELLTACCSASSMWAANAATVSPSADTQNGKVHFTPANLISNFHRAIEQNTTAKILRAIFTSEQHFQHHSALPSVAKFADEGAANHTRFCRDYGSSGVELFVYGHPFVSNKNTSSHNPVKYPARQTLPASEAIARKHQLDPKKVIFTQQNPKVIDQGVFHNDVIAVGNRNILFCHEQAFLHQMEVVESINLALDGTLQLIEVNTEQISVSDSVNSYLFNSQLLTLPDDTNLLAVPSESKANPEVWQYLQYLVESNSPIDKLKVFDLKQSMNNGGGPACLRLRIVLNQSELDACNQAVFMSDELYTHLSTWIDVHYRDHLSIADLSDPQLLIESRTALDELTQILQLGSVYPFQN
ncbi:MAG: N-succinylarginine dihydrolase [Neptuniibacter sp.]